MIRDAPESSPGSMMDCALDPVQSMLPGDVEVKLDRLLLAGIFCHAASAQYPSGGLASHVLI
jgi:hypothetical protein